MNERGWVIYRHPQTNRWLTRPEAMAIIEAEAISRVHNFPAVVLAAGQALSP
jgi:thiamine pyrophosphate-dependent acetolactate synthase large subunit-like protein